jgi:hypothetical protein
VAKAAPAKALVEVAKNARRVVGREFVDWKLFIVLSNWFGLDLMPSTDAPASLAAPRPQKSFFAA